MQDERCCGTVMYQEIDWSNTLVSTCKLCGKTKRRKVNFGNVSKETIENLDRNLKEDS